jgi:hypothetical protein
MTRHLLSSIINTEIAYYRKKERLRNVHKMTEYRFNTMKWKIKNDLEVWERIEKEKIIQEINKK